MKYNHYSVFYCITIKKKEKVMEAEQNRPPQTNIVHYEHTIKSTRNLLKKLQPYLEQVESNAEHHEKNKRVIQELLPVLTTLSQQITPLGKKIIELEEAQKQQEQQITTQQTELEELGDILTAYQQKFFVDSYTTTTTNAAVAEQVATSESQSQNYSSITQRIENLENQKNVFKWFSGGLSIALLILIWHHLHQA